MAAQGDGWSGMGGDWTDADDIRRRLDQGADPDDCNGSRPLHRAAVFGSAEAVAELARRVADVDALEDGVTALWEAVMSGRPANARALAAAGADPWRLSLGGWSPGRLSLAGPTPELFLVPEGVALTAAERAAAQEAPRLTAALGEFYYDGTGLACVAGIDAAEAVRRLEATPSSLGVTVWREASGDHFVQLSAGVIDSIVCNTCGASAASGRSWFMSPCEPRTSCLVSAAQ